MANSLVLVTDSGEERVALTCSTDLGILSELFLAESSKLIAVCPPTFSVSMSLNFGEHGASSVDVRATSAEQAAILHRLRPFVLQRESLFLPKYLNAIKRENCDDVTQRAMNFIRDIFILRVPSMIVQLQDGMVDLEDHWQQYVNAFEYHRDADKKHALNVSFGEDAVLTPYLFWTGVADKLRVVVQVRGLAAMLTGKVSTFAVKMASSPDDLGYQDSRSD